jgi:hypothetical protein
MVDGANEGRMNVGLETVVTLMWSPVGGRPLALAKSVMIFNTSQIQDLSSCTSVRTSLNKRVNRDKFGGWTEVRS